MGDSMTRQVDQIRPNAKLRGPLEIERYRQAMIVMADTEPSVSLQATYQGMANSLGWVLGQRPVLLVGLTDAKLARVNRELDDPIVRYADAE
jgi:hypothetical protein